MDVPMQERRERRSTEQLLEDLAELSQLAARLGVHSDPDDFDTGLVTDDIHA